MCSVSQNQQAHKLSLSVEVLQRSGCVRLVALGSSMLPTLWPGDRLTIQSTTVDQIRVGDVVLFARENRLFVHRVVRSVSKSASLITRGDAMPREDGELGGEELLGKVISVSRRDGEAQVPRCTVFRRCCGLILAYWGPIRSFALRARRSRNLYSHSYLASEVSPG
jgi:Peptidase S24-like